jgi:hypothetical protein
MDNGTHNLTDRQSPARADIVNRGQDTKITLGDGSTIVLKGVMHVEAVFSSNAASSETCGLPIGGALSGATD